MTALLTDFKEFLMKGNLVELAVAFVMGLAFAALVNSLVNDIIMPPVGLLMGNMDFSDLFVNLSMDASYPSLAAAEEAGAPIIKYGLFINNVLDFVIVAFAIFLLIRSINKLRRKQEAAPPPPPPAPSAEQKLLAEIRDLLKAQTR